MFLLSRCSVTKDRAQSCFADQTPERARWVGQRRPGAWGSDIRCRTAHVHIAVISLVLIAGALCADASGADDAGATAVAPGVVEAAPPGGLLEASLFYAVALPMVICTLGICISMNIVRMAVWLFGALGSVALLYFSLAADFLAAIQLIVYAGGTLVLLVFGVMLTSKSPWVRFDPRRIELVGAGVVCAGLFISLCAALRGTVWHGTEGIVAGASMAEIGTRLLTTYLVPFEAAGVLLMIVMVGAAHLARQEKH
ncbi:MAG: NADH-quinone oxidoreductase subunit J [Phycisphaerae bacterium]